MAFADFAVAKDVTEFHQLGDQLYAAVIVPGEVIAVGEVEGIDVPVVRVIAFFDDV